MAFNYYGQGATPGWWKQTTAGTPRNFTPGQPPTIPNTRIKDAFAAQMPAWFKAMLAQQQQMAGAGNLLTGGGLGGPPEIYQPPPGLGPSMAQAGGGGGYGTQAQGMPIGAPYQTPATFGPELWNNAFMQTQTGPYGVSTPTGYQPPTTGHTAGAPYVPPAAAQPQYQNAPPGIDPRWYKQFQIEHQGQTPDEYYAMTSAQANNPHEGLADALADLEWSQAFARDKGRPPNEDEWRWWWFTSREGGTPEAKAAAQAQGGGGGGGGGGNPTTTNPPQYVPPQVWWR